MTRVSFYFNVAVKYQLIENLVAAAVNKRRHVNILVDDVDAMASLSAYLWQNNAASFLPNVAAGAINAAKTSVLIGLHENGNLHECAIDALLQDDLLINLTQDKPDFFSRYTQLIELVGMDESEKIAGRNRYKFYRDRGYDISNVDYLQQSSHNNASI